MKESIWIVMWWPAIAWIASLASLFTGARAEDVSARTWWRFERRTTVERTAIEALARYERRFAITASAIVLAVTGVIATVLGARFDGATAIACWAAGLLLLVAFDPAAAILRTGRTLRWLPLADRVTWNYRRVYLTVADRLVAWLPVSPGGLTRAFEIAVPSAIARIRRAAKKEEPS